MDSVRAAVPASEYGCEAARKPPHFELFLFAALLEREFEVLLLLELLGRLSREIVPVPLDRLGIVPALGRGEGGSLKEVSGRGPASSSSISWSMETAVTTLLLKSFLLDFEDETEPLRKACAVLSILFVNFPDAERLFSTALLALLLTFDAFLSSRILEFLVSALSLLLSMRALDLGKSVQSLSISAEETLGVEICLMT